MKYQPVIIVGAPRSGTNLLRDVLTSLPEVATWPCDEINYIWRYGNAAFPSDELREDLVTPRIRGYIRSWFDWVANRYHANVVVEKTCANCLRLGFVHEIVPEAKYVVIRRNGIDAVVSAVKKWHSHPNWTYVARKARFVPARDLPFYLYRYIRQRWPDAWGGGNKPTRWGPVMHDSDQLLGSCGPMEYCAAQWSRCVECADGFLPALGQAKRVEIEYEEFVSEPLPGLQKILSFLGMQATEEQMRGAVAGVRADSVDKGVRSIDEKDRERIEGVAGPTLRRLGYI